MAAMSGTGGNERSTDSLNVHGCWWLRKVIAAEQAGDGGLRL